MNLADERLKGLDNPALTEGERVLLRCRVAADLIHRGQHEAAREALGELWRGIGERPNVEGLGDKTAAEVLLQAGVLSGWLGKVKGAQDAAKDLIGESAALFEKLGEAQRAADARADLSICYWREGAYGEARAVLESTAALIGESAALKAKTVLCFSVIESSAGRYSDALHLLIESAPLFGEGLSHRLRGIFHNELAIALRTLGTAERRQDYHDRAIIEYTAAAYHFEHARLERHVGLVENNLAFLLYKLGRYADAHAHLDRAQSIFTRLRDAGSLAHVDETRARVLVAEQRYRDAERTLAGALKTFEKGDESALLADALTLQGVIWARLWEYQSSINILRRAAEVAEGAGALLNAGQAILTLIEEHGLSRLLPPSEVYEAYKRADMLLRDAQDAEVIARLRASARLVMRRLGEPTRAEVVIDWLFAAFFGVLGLLPLFFAAVAFRACFDTPALRKRAAGVVLAVAAVATLAWAFSSGPLSSIEREKRARRMGDPDRVVVVGRGKEYQPYGGLDVNVMAACCDLNRIVRPPEGVVYEQTPRTGYVVLRGEMFSCRDNRSGGTTVTPLPPADRP